MDGRYVAALLVLSLGVAAVLVSQFKDLNDRADVLEGGLIASAAERALAACNGEDRAMLGGRPFDREGLRWARLDRSGIGPERSTIILYKSDPKAVPFGVYCAFRPAGGVEVGNTTDSNPRP